MISIIIPVFNEAENIKPLYDEIVSVLETLGKDFEIIFVNDGSTDETLNELKRLPKVTIINLRRSFGQTAGIDAGVKQSRGNIVITMDGDMQNDPNDIPKMLEKLNGYDAVLGWRKKRKDNLAKRSFSLVARKLRKILFNDEIHDAGCGLKVLKKECFKNLDLYGEMHRFIHLILVSRGFSITEVEVNHRFRTKGYTKYNWTRSIKALMDMFSVLFWRRFSNRPLHLLGGLGFGFISLGILGIITIIIVHFIANSPYETMFLIVLSTLILAGVQLFVLGLTIDIAIKSLFSTRLEKPYYISSILKTNNE